MARYTGAVCKLCRREGEKLFLKGSRCVTVKCSFEKKSYAPGQVLSIPRNHKVTNLTTETPCGPGLRPGFQ